MSPPFAEYVRACLSCFPVREDGSKAPAVATWREYADRPPTADEVATWEQRHGGIAIACGIASGNLEVLDIDEPMIARPFYAALRETDPLLLGKLTLIRTPRRNETNQPGVHFYYRVDGDSRGSVKLAMSEPEPQVNEDGTPRVNPTTGEQVTAPRTLIEIKGHGGYVLAPGSSPQCHATGRCYEYVDGPPITAIEVISAGEREVLHRVARTFDRSIAESHTEPAVRGYERGSDNPGDAFNRDGRWVEILEPHGWRCIGESGGIKRWRRPGKINGISATTGILSKSGNELLCVFSTNAHPFEGVNPAGRPGVTYSKFAGFAILNHRGDYEAAAKALLRMGYGTPRVPTPATHESSRVLKLTARDAERRYLEALRRGDTALWPLGIPALDAAIGGGVERGEMVIIGGLTSHGKSVCALQMLRHNCASGRVGVLISHEMGAFVIAKRLLQARAQWPQRDWLANADQIDSDSESYWQAAANLYIIEQCRGMDQIETEVQQIAQECDIGMVVIDHAQLTIGKGSSRYEQITNASGRFKELAVRYDCIALIPSQLNREAAKGDAAAHHLRESGALEQDADVIILARWPHRIDKSEPMQKYIFTVEKNRNRGIHATEIECKFSPARQTIKGLATYTEFESSEEKAF